MLVMFVVGMGSVGWMLALAARDGRREEPALGSAASHAAGFGLDRLGGGARAQQRLESPGGALAPVGRANAAALPSARRIETPRAGQRRGAVFPPLDGGHAADEPGPPLSFPHEDVHPA